jgi:hypothetical protein
MTTDEGCSNQGDFRGAIEMNESDTLKGFEQVGE